MFDKFLHFVWSYQSYLTYFIWATASAVFLLWWLKLNYMSTHSQMVAYLGENPISVTVSMEKVTEYVAAKELEGIRAPPELVECMGLRKYLFYYYEHCLGVLPISDASEIVWDFSARKSFAKENGDRLARYMSILLSYKGRVCLKNIIYLAPPQVMLIKMEKGQVKLGVEKYVPGPNDVKDKLVVPIEKKSSAVIFKYPENSKECAKCKDKKLPKAVDQSKVDKVTPREQPKVEKPKFETTFERRWPSDTDQSRAYLHAETPIPAILLTTFKTKNRYFSVLTAERDHVPYSVYEMDESQYIRTQAKQSESLLSSSFDAILRASTDDLLFRESLSVPTSSEKIIVNLDESQPVANNSRELLIQVELHAEPKQDDLANESEQIASSEVEIEQAKSDEQVKVAGISSTAEECDDVDKTAEDFVIEPHVNETQISKPVSITGDSLVDAGSLASCKALESNVSKKGSGHKVAEKVKSFESYAFKTVGLSKPKVKVPVKSRAILPTNANKSVVKRQATWDITGSEVIDTDIVHEDSSIKKVPKHDHDIDIGKKGSKRVHFTTSKGTYYLADKSTDLKGVSRLDPFNSRYDLIRVDEPTKSGRHRQFFYKLKYKGNRTQQERLDFFKILQKKRENEKGWD